MLNISQEIILKGDEKSFTEKTIAQNQKMAFVAETLNLPQPKFDDVCHLMSDKPLRFATRRVLQ